MQVRNFNELFKKIAAGGGIIVFFIMAFEVMIMISPFAFFFYSVFNPILHWLGDYPATRWLTSFFLPHMILPPTLFLKAVRILGSVLFVAGFLTFSVCAFQVYFGKLFKRGIANKGLYGIIRHPQYLALGLWGAGMSILWPRFLVLASLSFMFILYYFLARDEERRMLGQFGEGYREYMNRTGMFLPRSLEALLSARDVFYLSWVGRNQRDDALSPPSAVVGELRDYLDQSYSFFDGIPDDPVELILDSAALIEYVMQIQLLLGHSFSIRNNSQFRQYLRLKLIKSKT